MYWIYCLFLLFIVSLLNKGRYSTLTYKASLLIIFIFATGNYYNGVDWINYQKHYEFISNSGISSEYFAYEPGFLLLMYIFGNVLDIKNFHVIVIFISSISILSLSKFIKQIPKGVNKSLILFMLVAFIYPLYNDAIRQLFAFCIILPLLPNIKSIAIKKIIITCGIAALFHSSIILMVPLFILMRRELTQKFMFYSFICALLFLSLLINIEFIVNTLNNLIPKMLYVKLVNYVNNMGEFKVGFFAVIDFLGICIFCATYRVFKSNNDISVYAIGTFYFFILHLVFYGAPFLQRLLYYIFPLLSVYSCFIFSHCQRGSGARILLPLTLIMTLSVFARNIFNPYYATDFYEPKFFYTDGVFEKHLDVERLKYRKCSVIDEYDPNFCPK
ncbi:O116 family O-antigen polymerase [Escherichia coli]|uniref:O116 family O-antigen polymerase n=1 Tax=Escherichia coli TaxID=562 RepID=UPI001559D76D|nr:O116 family O-antigen polymerase [Escherichia coli]